MPIEDMKKYISLRLEDPKKFEVFRTHDIGKPARIQRIAGYDNRTKKWYTQAWRFHKDVFGLRNEKIYGKDDRAKLSLVQIKKRLPKYLQHYIY